MLDEENHRTNPCYESSCDLSRSYHRLCDLANLKRTPEGDAEASEWLLKAEKLAKENGWGLV